MAKRAALITGASGEIGLAIARVLGEEGYGLTLSARRAEKLEEAVQPLREEGFEVLTVPANMTSEEDVVAVFDAHKQRYGRLDALVNNAGVGSARWARRSRRSSSTCSSRSICGR
jgi:short-subunit dehydrogenase